MQDNRYVFLLLTMLLLGNVSALLVLNTGNKWWTLLAVLGLAQWLAATIKVLVELIKDDI